jgi:hypothetical protein
LQVSFPSLDETPLGVFRVGSPGLELALTKSHGLATNTAPKLANPSERDSTVHDLDWDEIEHLADSRVIVWATKHEA